jgi:hypothetical protein
MKRAHIALVCGLFIGGAAVVASARTTQSFETPTYTTAQVVSIDIQNRMLVFRASDGKARTAKLDDGVAAFPQGIKTGDRVIVSLRNEPGLPRISSIVKSQLGRPAPPAPRPVGAAPVPAATPLVLLGPDTAAGRAYDERVATIALDANRVDGLWSTFRNSCDVTLSGSFQGSREWVSLWTGQAKSDLSSGFCRDLYNQIVGLGDAVSQAMASADEGVRDTLLPGAIREIRVRYSMDFNGWGSRPPDRQKP